MYTVFPASVGRCTLDKLHLRQRSKCTTSMSAFVSLISPLWLNTACSCRRSVFWPDTSRSMDQITRQAIDHPNNMHRNMASPCASYRNLSFASFSVLVRNLLGSYPLEAALETALFRTILSTVVLSSLQVAALLISLVFIPPTCCLFELPTLLYP